MEPSRTNQHYVPQFLLRGFASGRKKQVFTFDKQCQRTFKTSIRNVAGQSGFYDFEANGESRSLDPLLKDLEGKAAPIVQTILRVRQLGFLSEEQRHTLALFVVSQMLRTDAQRQKYKHLNDMLCEAIKRMGGDPDNVEGFKPLSDEEARRESILMLPKLALDLLPHVLNKTWVLYSAPLSEQYYASDNPVVMHNTTNQNPYRGTLGVAVEGIEIYLPISGSLCLGFLCPTIEAMIPEGEAKARRLATPISFAKWTRAFDEATPIRLEAENVIHHNSLQVINAERYVFSHNGRFELAQEMLTSNPELRTGPRLTSN